MKLSVVGCLTFGYSHSMKTAYKKGLIPNLKRGIYGEEIKIASIEHLTPHSQGGATTWDNIAITDKKANSLRGTTPIEQLVSKEMWINYLKQFKNVYNKYIDGLKYIKTICKRFNIDIQKVID